VTPEPALLRVAVVDTGIDPAHPDLAPVIAGVHLLPTDDGSGVRRDADWQDTAGHGTACAGIVSRGLRAPQDDARCATSAPGAGASFGAASGRRRWAFRGGGGTSAPPGGVRLEGGVGAGLVVS